MKTKTEKGMVLVWDLQVRVFHWLLVASYAAAYFTSRSEWYLDYHTAAGYVALGLVTFRLLWGFAGNRYARFSDFVKGPGPIIEYLKGVARFSPRRYLGHNPAVGLVVIFMLLSTAVITLTGVIVYAGEEGRGIFADAVTYEMAEYARPVHDIFTTFFVAVIVIHVIAALFHDFILRENIILSMITGRKEDERTWEERTSHMAPEEGRSKLRLATLILVAVMGGLGLIYLPPEGHGDYEEGAPLVADSSGIKTKVPVNGAWKNECATSCHSAFHPTLLPERSWKALMSGLDDHFGDNVTLDEETGREILGYLTAYPAERSDTEASRKILKSIGNDTPLRITEAPYWRKKHADIKDEVYARKSVSSKSNCVACHPGAESGAFEDRDIRIPKQ